MVPIHETDLASKRFDLHEWTHYELWEKIEAKQRRKKRLWIVFGLFAFLLLSSIWPILQLAEKCASYTLATQAALLISRVKTQAALLQSPVKITFQNSLTYIITLQSSCSEENTFKKTLETGTLTLPNFMSKFLALTQLTTQYMLLSPENTLNLPNISNTFCYDPQQGVYLPITYSHVGYVIAPIHLTHDPNILDKIGIIIIEASTGQISLN